MEFIDWDFVAAVVLVLGIAWQLCEREPDYSAEWPLSDPAFMRHAWLIVVPIQIRRGKVMSALEASWNVVRPNPARRWRSGTPIILSWDEDSERLEMQVD